ncbi:MAG TPA: OmpH family outer membrane protein [Sphingomicrobium sp.]
MKKILICTAAALTALAVPTAALAQARAAILIVDSERVLSDCTACKSAGTQLQSKQAALRTRAQQLQTQLQSEGKPIQAAVDALNGKDPDAALTARIKAFQTKEQGAQQELQTGQRTLESTAAHVQQQIGAKVITIVEQVRASRGASIVLAKNSTMANDGAIDVTTDVLTALNQQLPAVSVTPLPQQTAPQGR